MTARLVSVVVPAFQAERFLGPALDSALAQDHPALEVIVVDDGSTDGTARIAASRPVRLLSQPNQGPAAARNAGIAAARGEYLAILDADDLWPHDRVSTQAAHLDAHPEVGLVLGLTHAFLSPGEPHDRPFPRTSDGELVAGIPGTMMVRRSVLDAVGRFDEDLRLCEDVDWLARAKDQGVVIAMLDQVMLRYRIHRGNTSRDASGVQAGLLQVLRSSVQRSRSANGG
jgi:glycosyltransferase involved in cell wall biosynthesis